MEQSDNPQFERVMGGMEAIALLLSKIQLQVAEIAKRLPESPK